MRRRARRRAPVPRTLRRHEVQALLRRAEALCLSMSGYTLAWATPVYRQVALAAARDEITRLARA